MYPLVDDSPLSESYVKGKTVVDLIFNPLITKLMSYSNDSYSGIIMLISQALKSEEFWQNKKIDIDINYILNKLKDVINNV